MKNKNFLNNDIREAIKCKFGTIGLKIIEELSDIEELSEDELINKLNVPSYYLRKVLFKLNENRIILYKKISDEDSGYYFYYWKLNPDGLKRWYIEYKKCMLDELRTRLKRLRDTQIYYCEKDSMEYTFEEAIKLNFKCKNCGKYLNVLDTEKIINEIENTIKRIEEELRRIC